MMHLLVSDFDRTIYRNQTISETNQESVKRWQQSGNLFAIATGRNLDSLLAKLNPQGLKPDYFICNNGAVIYDSSMAVLQSSSMDSEVAREIIEYLVSHYEPAVGINALGKNVKVLGSAQIDTRIGDEVVVDIKEGLSLPAILQVAIKFTDVQSTKAASAYLQEKFIGKVSAYPNVCNLDIVADGINKAEAVAFLATQYQCGNVVTIGDSYNDIGMIQRFQGYTLADAAPEIQKIAYGIVPEAYVLIDKILSRK